MITDTEEGKALQAHIDRREQFKELLDELTTDTDFMLKRPNWSPDEDDIETLLTIQEELYWYALATKNKERVKK